MRCRECYSDNPRITPILKPEHCLENHLQYIYAQHVGDVYVLIKMISEMFTDGVFHSKHWNLLNYI